MLFPCFGRPRVCFPRQVSIRPFTHNEYDRFLLAAYPYYTSALSIMVGFIVFCAAFLFTGDDPKRPPAKGVSVVK